MNSEELHQLSYLKREVLYLKNRISELECAATSVGVEITGMPQGTGISDKVSNYVSELVDLKGLLTVNLNKCIYELNRLNKYIASIEDSEMRLILTLRYVNGLTWEQVALGIGEKDEQYPRRRHNRFLEKDKSNNISGFKSDENDEEKMVK